MSLSRLQFWTAPLALMITFGTYILVRTFGDCGGFKHHGAYSTLEDIQSLLGKGGPN
ncbi:MAG: hypothetical protein P8M25_09740 [Paracoccaceae bacterium]|nr:hypothetical protein [Paracoccaceae bacterium]